jgi:hypothetical protein
MAAAATTCAPGVYECEYAAKFHPSEVDSCVAYDGSLVEPAHLRWLVVAGGVTMCVMAFGIGRVVTPLRVLHQIG